MGITKSKVVLVFFVIPILVISSLTVTAFATTESDELEQEWKVLAGKDLLNNPLAARILENIEISKQRIAELENSQLQMTEQQKFVETQRKIVQEKLDQELNRMYKDNEDYTPRAAFAKYVEKKPQKYHEFYWELFNYLDNKVSAARLARDQIIDNGGTREQANQVFIALAKMPSAERLKIVNEMNVKYNLLNKISNPEDFKKLPVETRDAYDKYFKNPPILTSDYDKPYVDTTIQEGASSVELVSFSSPFILEETEQVSSKVQDVPNKTKSDTVISLNGKSYTTKDLDSMDNVSELTLSAWVKPDYSKGSSEFTIMSKEKAFDLSINHNISPKQVVRFSVFDGIKWTTLESNSIIKEEWTHIAVTFDNSSIKLYINGHLDYTKSLDSGGINSFGFSSASELVSNGEIIIGAEQTTRRGVVNHSAYFSGSLDEIIIEDKLFDEKQVEELGKNSQYFSI